jgi:hypothetical protein
MVMYRAEQVVTLLRQIEVAVANTEGPPQACKEAHIITQAYYRWRKGIRRPEGGSKRSVSKSWRRKIPS